MVNHTYDNQGIYLVTVTATDNDGNTGSGQVYVRVLPADYPTAAAGASPAGGAQSSFTVALTGAGSDDTGPIVLYEWDFDGDGTYDYQSDTTGDTVHNYTRAGDFDAMLRVTDSDGNQDIDVVRVQSQFGITAGRTTERIDPWLQQQAHIYYALTSPATVTVRMVNRQFETVRILVQPALRQPGAYQILWDGKADNGQIVPDGIYSVLLDYAADGVTRSLDLTGQVSLARQEPGKYYPSSFDTLADKPLYTRYALAQPAETTVYVAKWVGYVGDRVKTVLLREPRPSGTYIDVWDGTDDEGNMAPPWQYVWSVMAWNLPDNAIIVDSRPVISDMSKDPDFFLPAANPYNTSADDNLAVSFRLSKDATVAAFVQDETDAVVRQLPAQALTTGQQQLTWDGRDAAGHLVTPGIYRMGLQATDTNGNVSRRVYSVFAAFFIDSGGFFMTLRSFRAIQWFWVIALVGGLIAVAPGLGTVYLAVAFDQQHDTGHATSDQKPPKPDKPPDKPDPDEDEDPIELITGNFKYEHEDLNFTSGRTLLAVTRYYNNQDRYNGPLGYAWNMNFHMQAIPVSKGSQNYVIVRDFNGVRYRFSENADGSYTPPAGWFHQLRRRDGQAGLELVKTSGRIYTFDADGDLVGIRSCCTAEAFSLLYDNQKRLEAVQDGSGGGFFFSYNDLNKISAISDHSGRRAEYFYNERLELREYHSPYGLILRYVYDEDHNIIRILDGLGQLLLANTYGDTGQVLEQTNQGGTFTFSYATVGVNTRVTVTDQDGRSRIHLLNPTGQPLQVTDRNGKNEFFTWNDIQRLTSYTNRLGEVFGFEYDAAGRRTRTIFPDERDITVTYDAQGRRTAVTDSDGRTTTFSYDAQGQLTRKTLPSGERFSAYTYDAEGRLTALYDAATSAQNPLYTVTHSPEGQISRIDYPNGQYEAFEYNALGAQTGWTTRGGNDIVYGYTDGGLLDRVSYRLGNVYAVYRYVYDPAGNLVEVQDPAGNRTRLVVDHFDRLTGVIDPLGNTTQFSYEQDHLAVRNGCQRRCNPLHLRCGGQPDPGRLS